MIKKITCIVCCLVCLSTPPVKAQMSIISTIAGNGTTGYSGDGASALSATFNYTSGLWIDQNKNLYVSDMYNNVIRKIDTNGIIRTIAGNGTFGYSGDGGPATAAKLTYPQSIAGDIAGNLYIADLNNSRIRKVGPTGIISTLAGNGAVGYGGDGGPAIASVLNQPSSVATDNVGNVYICDRLNSRIRKVDATGTITTVAGNGIPGYGGDGGPATAAKLNNPQNIGIDNAGNLYITDFDNSRIRKVDAAGIITTFAGTGTYGFTGDGGPATAAMIGTYWGSVYPDNSGNVYIADHYNNRVRKVNSAGIITTIAGNGTGAYSGDGGPATFAALHGPNYVLVDNSGGLYISDQSNNVIRKSQSTPDFISDSFLVFINKLCTGPEMTIATIAFGTAYNQTTYFGDGTSSTTPIYVASAVGVSGYTVLPHTYALPGTYTIRTVLRNGTTVIDSLTYYYQYKMCNVLQAKFYIDRNTNLAYDPSFDVLSGAPVTVEIDSNGIPVDTINATSGFYYAAYGTPGTIYKMKIISAITGLTCITPASGEIIDTLQSPTYNRGIKYFGLTCTGVSSDLRIHIANRCRPDRFNGQILVDNLYGCYGATGPATVTMDFGAKYCFQAATPIPNSVVGNIATWVFPSVPVGSLPQSIYISGLTPVGTANYLPGDTAHFLATVNPIGGDLNATDNVINPCDTIRSGYDPNYIAVSPQAYIPSGTRLEYTVGFENTGNDTAFNIHVLDTLSDDLDPSTINIISASAAMDLYRYTAGGHTILKFDFPHINLLDSSHHDLCHGMVIYTIKTRNGLPDCTHIPNRAGIYFDLNPVVMTNTVENIIGPPPVLATLTGASNLCTGNVTTITTSIAGGVWSVSNANATVSAGAVTALSDGPVFVYYTTPAACGPVTAQFLINIGPLSPGFMLNSDAMCLGSSITLSSTVSGGTWSIYGSNTSLSGNTLTGLSTGTDTVYYTVTSACGSSITQQTISIDIPVLPGAISGPTTVCEGSTISMSNLVPGGIWAVSNGHASVSASGVVTGIYAGLDSVKYTITNGCGSNSTVVPVNVVYGSSCFPVNIEPVDNIRSVQLFPNPVNNMLTIRLSADDYSLAIVSNNIGQVLLQAALTGITTELSVETLPPGLYYITLKGNNGHVVKKFVKL